MCCNAGNRTQVLSSVHTGLTVNQGDAPCELRLDNVAADDVEEGVVGGQPVEERVNAAAPQQPRHLRVKGPAGHNVLNFYRNFFQVPHSGG